MKSIIFKFILGSVLLGGAAAGYFVYDIYRFSQTHINVQADGLEFEVKSGDTLKKVSRLLHQSDVIDQPRYLELIARIKGKASHIKVGEYHFKPNITVEQLLDKLVKGEVIQYSATIIEGWTFKEMMQALAKHNKLRHTLEGKSGKEIMALLGKPDVHPEGWFLPDTYSFTKGTTDLEFLKRAHKAMEQTLSSLWPQRQEKLPLKTSYEALILASIVEKETGVEHERPAIAGVFIRRLNKRMRLQTDPTVIYGMGDKFKGNIRRKDLKTDTPYNTYTRRGLPPTPIALPGKDAIYAALNPDDSNNLYFVSRGDGSHVFSSNLRDHNNAVIKYQLKGRYRPFSSMPRSKKQTAKN